jgi:hypothetical protein
MDMFLSCLIYEALVLEYTSTTYGRESALPSSSMPHTICLYYAFPCMLLLPYAMDQNATVRTQMLPTTLPSVIGRAVVGTESTIAAIAHALYIRNT